MRTNSYSSAGAVTEEQLQRSESVSERFKSSCPDCAMLSLAFLFVD